MTSLHALRQTLLPILIGTSLPLLSKGTFGYNQFFGNQKSLRGVILPAIFRCGRLAPGDNAWVLKKVEIRVGL